MQTFFLRNPKHKSVFFVFADRTAYVICVVCKILLGFYAQAQKPDSASVLNLLTLSDSAASIGNYDSSLYYASKANTLAGEINYFDGKKKALLKTGIANLVLYKNEEALKNLEEAIAIARQMGDKKSEAEISISKGWTLAKFDYTRAITAFKKGLDLANEVSDLTLVAKANWGISESYSALGNYPESINYSYKAIRFFEALKQPTYVALIYSSQGYVYEKQNSFKEAFRAYEKSLQLATEAGNNILIANAYSSLGQLDFNNNLLDDALTKFNRALKVFNEDWENYKTNIADCYESISKVLEKKADQKVKEGNTSEAQEIYQQALEKCEAALELFEQGDLKIGMATSQNRIGNIYLKLKDYKKANQFLSSGIKIAKEANGIAELKDYYLSFANLSESTSDFKSAYQNYKLHVLYRDSLLNEENTKKTVQSQMQFEFDKKEALTKAEQEKKDAIAQQKMIRQRNLRNATLGGLAAVLVFAIVVYRQRNKISKEKKRSENLLLNILPAETAEELKNTGEAKAKSFDSVTVLFTDFKNFTQASEKLSAEELVKEINYCYSAFDRIVTQFGIEKIKTIGDAYMCAGGLPKPNQTHAADVVNAAIAMQQFILNNKKEREKNGMPYFELRVGVHSGPVVAGIVGTKKFAYDIWGDTVNTASRMESSGEIGKVNISGATYELVKGLFSCTHRGKVQAKNKGEIDMYFVD